MPAWASYSSPTTRTTPTWWAITSSSSNSESACWTRSGRRSRWTNSPPKWRVGRNWRSCPTNSPPRTSGSTHMAVNVGVIGVGMIGKDHIRRLTTVLAGADVVAVTDVNADEARRVADGVPGSTVYSTGQELIKADNVDAIVVCSWGPTHEEYVLAAIEAGKPVF